MKILARILFTILLTGASAHAAAPAVHGMFVFGDQATYVSHLPMFHAPHDMQLILKVKLGDVRCPTARNSYLAAKAAGKTLFTLEPELMDLELLANGSKTEFKAAVYDGHFERGGKKLGWLKVQVEKIILSTPLNGAATPSVIDHYLVFGGAGEYFAAHLIQAKPSFDAILKIGKPYQTSLPYCRTRLCAEPATGEIADSELPLTLPAVGNVQTLSHLGTLRGAMVDVQSLLYLETGDLSH
jgi:hypothetical protein